MQGSAVKKPDLEGSPIMPANFRDSLCAELSPGPSDQPHSNSNAIGPFLA
jgi:hypothetical protein